MAAKHVVMYFSRVKHMLPDQDAQGKLHARPVKTMLVDAIDRQTGRWSIPEKSTPTGLRFSTAITQFFRKKTDTALQGAFGSVAQWDDAIAGCMRREMREETEYLVANCKNGPSKSGVWYLACRKKVNVGVPYYLQRARVMAAMYSRSNALYRLIHLLEGGVTCAGE